MFGTKKLRQEIQHLCRRLETLEKQAHCGHPRTKTMSGRRYKDGVLSYFEACKCCGYRLRTISDLEYWTEQKNEAEAQIVLHASPIIETGKKA